MDRFTQSWLARTAYWLVPKEYEATIKENTQQHIQQTLQHQEFSKLMDYLQTQMKTNPDGVANISIAAGPVCHDLTEDQKTTWSKITQTINQQFKDWGIAVRFVLEANATNSTNASNNQTNYAPHSILLEHCQNSQPWQQRDANSHHIFNMPTDPSTEEGAREIALYLRTYLHTYHNDSIVLAKLRDPLLAYTDMHPDLRESMCNPVVHDFETTTILPSKEHCIEHGYVERVFIFGERSEKLGYFDEGAIKCIFPDSLDGYDLCVNQTTEATYQWIAENYGAKVASSFSASFVKEIAQQLLMNAVARCDLSNERRDIALTSVKIIASFLQCAVLVGGGLPAVATASVITAAELSGSKTLKSLTHLLGEANLVQLMLQIMRGNGFALIAIGTAFAGKYTGHVLGEGLNQIFDHFSSMTKQQRKDHVEALNQLPGIINHSPLSYAAKKIAEQTSEHTQTVLKTIASNIAYWDKTMAHGIEQYLNLRCLTSYLWQTKETSPAEVELMTSFDSVIAVDGLLDSDTSDPLVESSQLITSKVNPTITEDVI